MKLDLLLAIFGGGEAFLLIESEREQSFKQFRSEIIVEERSKGGFGHLKAFLEHEAARERLLAFFKPLCVLVKEILMEGLFWKVLFPVFLIFHSDIRDGLL